MLKPLVFLCSINLCLAACVSATPDSFELQSKVAEKTGQASCAQLRRVMVDAKAAREKSKNVQVAGDIATIGGLGLSVVPGIGLIAPLLTGAGIFGQTKGTYGTVKPEVLYTASHRRYHKKGCKPAIQFGN